MYCMDSPLTAGDRDRWRQSSKAWLSFCSRSGGSVRRGSRLDTHFKSRETHSAARDLKILQLLIGLTAARLWAALLLLLLLPLSLSLSWTCFHWGLHTFMSKTCTLPTTRGGTSVANTFESKQNEITTKEIAIVEVKLHFYWEKRLLK